MRLAVLLAAVAVLRAQGLDQAYEALRHRDYDGAIAGFEREIAANPGKVNVRKDLAYVLLKIGENARARAQFEEALKLDPGDHQVALEYAFLCNEAGEVAKARRIFDRELKTGNAIAEQAFQNIDGPLAAGIARWKKAIELRANDFSVHFELASLAEQRDELELAAEHYERAWRVLPDRKSVLVELGRVWKALGHEADANAALLAALHGGESRAAEAARELLPPRTPYVSEYRHALDFEPASLELRREMAFLLLRVSKQPEAEQEFRALAKGGDLLSATQLGFLLHARGEKQESQALFEQVLAGKDEDLANRVRAVLHMQQLQARAAAPAKIDAREMAERSIKAGYIKDAVKYLLKALESDPDDTGIMLQLAWAYNILRDDKQAFHYYGKALWSSDPAIAAEAEKGWRNLRPATERVRATAWLFPMFSTHWHDAFGYAQVKTDLRTGIGIRPYLSVRVVGDAKGRLPLDSMLPRYLSENSVILGAGVATTPWHGLVAWGEAGQAFNYLGHRWLPDYRGGLSVGRGVGHSLRGESPGWFADDSADAVFVSRFGNDLLFYNKVRFGYTAGSAGFRVQIYGAGNVTFDDQRQYWANFGEAGMGMRISGTFLPQSMYLVVEGFRGAYFINTGNPYRPNFNDFRAGLWYAFTR